MGDTTIEYADKSWNPLAMRCTRVSPGCDHCWHLRMCKRHAKNPNFDPQYRQAWAGGKPILCENILTQPLHWRTPRRVAVQFMGDLFHPDVPPGFVADVFGTMVHASQHEFLVLTKRS